MDKYYIAGAGAAAVVILYVIVGLMIKAIIKAVKSRRDRQDNPQIIEED